MKKDRKGWDFGNAATEEMHRSFGAKSAPQDDNTFGYGMKAMVPLGPTTKAPPSGYGLTALKP
jgi:hypothetical protein